MKSILVAGILAIAGVGPGPACAETLADDIATSIVTVTKVVTSTAPPTSTNAVSTRKPLERIYFNCHDGRCPRKSELYDPNARVPEHSCVRDTLTALAKWRYYCDDDKLVKHYCWSKAPNIHRCCGKWVPIDDPAWADYPTARARKEVTVDPFANTYRVEYPEVYAGHHKGHRLIVQRGWADYKSHDKICRKWRSGGEAEFSYFMYNLATYGAQDADSDGKVWGLEKWNPEGPGYLPNYGLDQRDALIEETKQAARSNSTTSSSGSAPT